MNQFELLNDNCLQTLDKFIFENRKVDCIITSPPYNMNLRVMKGKYVSRCNNKNHKNSKNGDKQTHGIDLLFKYINPFNNQYEAVIIECKNRKWNEFIPSNLNKWTNELLNTLECSVCTDTINNYLSESTLKTGILLFNSSDNEYTKERAEQNIAQMSVPRRKLSTMLLLADTFLIEKNQQCSESDGEKTADKRID